MALFSKKQNESDEQTNGNTNKTLGLRIADARKQRGYTQEEFSQLLGVTAQAVSKWENDLSCPDIQLLPKISELLEISIDELLTGKTKTSAEKVNTNTDISKLSLRIKVFKPDKKPVNVSFPMALVKRFAKIGNGISGIVGSTSLDSVQLEQILELVEEGVTGEVLNVTAEDDTNVIIEIS